MNQSSPFRLFTTDPWPGLTKVIFSPDWYLNKKRNIKLCLLTLFKVKCFQVSTGKSFSEAFIFASTKPQYDKRFFTELQVQYMKISSSEHAVNTNCSFCFDIQNNLCTQHVLAVF